MHGVWAWNEVRRNVTGREDETWQSEGWLFDLPLVFSLSSIYLFLACLAGSKQILRTLPHPLLSVWVCLISVTHEHTHTAPTHGDTTQRHPYPPTNVQRHSALFIHNSKHRQYIIHSLMCDYVTLSVLRWPTGANAFQQPKIFPIETCWKKPDAEVKTKMCQNACK